MAPPVFSMSTDSGYPNGQERRMLDAAVSFMEETMAKYDPSHDAFHGACKFTLERV